MGHAIGLLLVGVVVLVLKKACELILEKEYPTWAGMLARLFVRSAGRLCPQLRNHWWADLMYEQGVLGKTGLNVGGKCLVGVPTLVLRRAWLRIVTFLEGHLRYIPFRRFLPAGRLRAA